MISSAWKELKRTGPAALMGKQDIKSAFRLIPVRRADWRKLAFQLDGEFYFDVVLPFGCRSSPFLFCQFSDAIRWIVEQRSGLHSMLHYVDDFLSVGKANTGECAKLMGTMAETCDLLGVPLAAEKQEGPTTSLAFLGILLDSVAQTLSLPPGKLVEVQKLVKSWLAKTSCSRTELQSLIGSLMFASKCVPAGRLFTRRRLRLLRSPSSPVRHQGTHDGDATQIRSTNVSRPLAHLPVLGKQSPHWGTTLETRQSPPNPSTNPTSGPRFFKADRVFTSETARSQVPEPGTSGPPGNPLLSTANPVMSWPQITNTGSSGVHRRTPPFPPGRSRGTQCSYDNFRLDLKWWDHFLPLWNGTASFLEPDWSKPDVLHLYADASATLGLGAVFHEEWFQSHWPSWILDGRPAIEYPSCWQLFSLGKRFFGRK